MENEVNNNEIINLVPADGTMVPVPGEGEGMMTNLEGFVTSPAGIATVAVVGTAAVAGVIIYRQNKKYQECVAERDALRAELAAQGIKL